MESISSKQRAATGTAGTKPSGGLSQPQLMKQTLFNNLEKRVGASRSTEQQRIYPARNNWQEPPGKGKRIDGASNEAP